MSEAINQAVNDSAKQQILHAALKIFGDRGFSAASIREIATAAGVNHALIKYHFGSKEALWHSAVDWMFTNLDELIQAVVAENAGCDDPAARFRTLLRHYVRYCAEHPEHARIMVQESNNENPRLAWAVERHISRSHLFDDMLTELIENAALPRVSTISLRYIFAGACQNLFTLAAEAKLMYGVDVRHEAQIEAHIDAVTKLFLRDSGSRNQRAQRRNARVVLPPH